MCWRRIYFYIFYFAFKNVKEKKTFSKTLKNNKQHVNIKH